MSKYETDEAYHRGVFHGVLYLLTGEVVITLMLAFKWWMGE